MPLRYSPGTTWPSMSSSSGPCTSAPREIARNRQLCVRQPLLQVAFHDVVRALPNFAHGRTIPRNCREIYYAAFRIMPRQPAFLWSRAQRMAASSYVGNRGLVARYAVLADIVDHQLLSLHCIFRRASPSSAIAKYPIIGARWMSAKDMSAPQRYSVSATSRSNAASTSGAASKPL